MAELHIAGKTYVLPDLNIKSPSDEIPCTHCKGVWLRSAWMADMEYLNKYGYICGDCVHLLEMSYSKRQGRLFRKSK